MAKDAKKYKCFQAGGMKFFYEEKDGKKTLRYIQIFNDTKVLEVRGDVQIDIIPQNSVDSDAIKDGSIEKEDLSEDVQKGLDELNNISLTDEDLEDIFFPSDETGENGGTQEAGS